MSKKKSARCRFLLRGVIYTCWEVIILLNNAYGIGWHPLVGNDIENALLNSISCKDPGWIHGSGLGDSQPDPRILYNLYTLKVRLLSNVSSGIPFTGILFKKLSEIPAYRYLCRYKLLYLYWRRGLVWEFDL